MAEVKHTLRVEGGANSHFFDGCLLDQDGKCLAFVGLDHPLTPMIAAAPDLFDALQEAKGLADMAEMYDGPGEPSDDQKQLIALRAKIDAALSKATTQQEGR